jgi:asparagine synthase (glutamine-hydrolysing)
MCGIGGLFLPRGATPVAANVEAMQAVMRHRGPDSTGAFTSADRRFQAAFVRLSIIDLSTGDQPIVEGVGRRVLMGNGEIYNYVELRRETPEYPYQTEGDMEVALSLSARHGDAFVHKLNGIYGLALYERDPHRLLLVRDRLGVKPIYWTRLAGGGVLFASEIKALFASGLVAPAVDEDVVSAYLSHGYVASPHTLFRGIRKLPPGHLLRVDADGAIEIERYWRAQPVSDLPPRAPEVREYLADLLRDAVRLQLRSDVPVGALLSGGIDSGLVVAMAAQESERPLKTFTVTFEGAAVDEAPLAESVARRYATEHTGLVVRVESASTWLPRLSWHLEEPLHDRGLLPNYLVTKCLSEHVKVALDGTGGDELFAGYRYYFRDPREARYLGLPRWLRRGLLEPLAARVSPVHAWKLRRAEKFLSDRSQYFHEHRDDRFPPPVRTLLGNRLPLPEPFQRPFFEEFGDGYQSAALYADLSTHLPDDILTLVDRTSMAVSVESRVPFLDHRLVEAALAVPPEIRTPGGAQKGLEREIASGLLPERVTRAPKEGFSPPLTAWLRGDLGPVVRRLLTSRDALARGWWTAEGVERALGAPDTYGSGLYILLMLELGIRMLVESPCRREPPGETLEEIADAA